MAKPARRKIGKYEVVKPLAQGGMAEIFLARQRGIGGFSRRVVLKRILPALADERRFVQMFLEEARLASVIHHPNVVQIFDVDEDDESYYIAMEYIDGLSVGGILDYDVGGGKAVPYPVAGETIIQACAGLHAAHELKGEDDSPLGLVHRDVSPQNLMITRDGVVKLLDFGIAKAQGSSVTTRTGNIKGKYAYMSPEQVRGDPLDRRSDIFALGTMFYELLTGKRLFDRPAELAILVAILEDPIPTVHELDQTIPGELSDVIAHALEREREDRFTDAAQMGSAVRKVLAHLGHPTSTETLASFLKEERGETLDAVHEEVRKAELTPTRDVPAHGDEATEPWTEAAPGAGVDEDVDDERWDDEPTVQALADLAASEVDMVAEPSPAPAEEGSAGSDDDDEPTKAARPSASKPQARRGGDADRVEIPPAATPVPFARADGPRENTRGKSSGPEARAPSPRGAPTKKGAGYRPPVVVARRGRQEDIVDFGEPEPAERAIPLPDPDEELPSRPIPAAEVEAEVDALVAMPTLPLPTDDEEDDDEPTAVLGEGSSSPAFPDDEDELDDAPTAVVTALPPVEPEPEPEPEPKPKPEPEPEPEPESEPEPQSQPEPTAEGSSEGMPALPDSSKWLEVVSPSKLSTLSDFQEAIDEAERAVEGGGEAVDGDPSEPDSEQPPAEPEMAEASPETTARLRRQPAPARQRSPLLAALLVVVVVALLGGVGYALLGPTLTPAEPPLLYAVPPVYSPETNEQELRPIADYLGKKIGRTVEIVTPRDYRSLRTELEAGDIHFANVPPLLLLQSRQSEAGLEVLAVPSYGGTQTSQSYIVARRNSGIESLEELEGRTFCYPDRNSTSGYLLPRHFLRTKGLDPDRMFESSRFSGSHVTVLEDIAAGHCDGGAVLSGAWLAAESLGVETAQIRVVSPAGETTRDVVCASPKVPAGLRSKLREALLSFDAGRDIDGDSPRPAIPIAGFVEASLDDLAPVEAAARAEKLVR